MPTTTAGGWERLRHLVAAILLHWTLDHEWNVLMRHSYLLAKYRTPRMRP